MSLLFTLFQGMVDSSFRAAIADRSARSSMSSSYCRIGRITAVFFPFLSTTYVGAGSFTFSCLDLANGFSYLTSIFSVSSTSFLNSCIAVLSLSPN